MLEVEPGPELENDAAGYSSRRDGGRNPGSNNGQYPLAKSCLETSFAETSRLDPTKAVRALRAKFDQRTISWELLRDLTHETSVDFATLYFIRRTLMDQHTCCAEANATNSKTSEGKASSCDNTKR
jgi:hypothetical protein